MAFTKDHSQQNRQIDAEAARLARPDSDTEDLARRLVAKFPGLTMLRARCHAAKYIRIARNPKYAGRFK